MLRKSRLESGLLKPRISDLNRVRLVVLQSTSFCNIDCSYCYLANRNTFSKLKIELIERLFYLLAKDDALDSRVVICWHSGEPTVLPIEYYKSAFEAIEAHRPENVEFRHIFQTNGLLLDPEWASFFLRHHVGVGLSLDGPAAYHDAFRLDRKRRGTHEKAELAAKTLADAGVDYHIICVLNRRSLECPVELYEYFKNLGVTGVCFNVDETIGVNDSHLSSGNSARFLFGNFIQAFYQRLLADDFPFWVREIENAFAAVLKDINSRDENNHIKPFWTINLGATGNITTFCPELMGQRNSTYSDFVLGNVENSDPIDWINNAVLHRMIADIQAGVELCQATCSYFEVCGGGTPSNKLYENGSFASSQTMHCTVKVQALADFALANIMSRGTTRNAIEDVNV